MNELPLFHCVILVMRGKIEGGSLRTCFTWEKLFYPSTEESVQFPSKAEDCTGERGSRN